MTEDQKRYNRACKIWAEIQSIVIEVDAYNIANKVREQSGLSPKYSEDWFKDAARRIRELAEEYDIE